ncbi:rCG40797 [Rattus norvegicus]|uniref:RCG40797 n=1 Tax=Rattus norvegicus TaxID=10116 RepID=A6KNZ2_RAT|nr:rCG40797 [Rattus norvegicus]
MTVAETSLTETTYREKLTHLFTRAVYNKHGELLSKCMASLTLFPPLSTLVFGAPVRSRPKPYGLLWEVLSEGR